MLGNFELIEESFEKFTQNAAEIRFFIANFRKISSSTDFNRLNEEQLRKLASLVEAVTGRMKSHSNTSNRPYTSLQAEIAFGLQWFLNVNLQNSLKFPKVCRRIVHLGLKPTLQAYSVADEWLRVDLQLSTSGGGLVAADEVDEETLVRLLQREPLNLAAILKNNPSSKKIISFYFESHFDAELLTLLDGSLEVSFIGDKLGRLPVLQLQKLDFSVLKAFATFSLLNSLIEMGSLHPDHEVIKGFTEKFLQSTSCDDTVYCTLFSSFVVAYSEDHSAELDSHFLAFSKRNFATCDNYKCKIALCRGIAANIKHVDSELIRLLLQELFGCQSNKLKWNILVALKAAVGVHEPDFVELKANWLNVLEALDNFKVALNFTQLLCTLASFNDDTLITCKGDFEIIWNAHARSKSFGSVADESVAECGEKLSNLLQDLLGSSDWLKGGF
jgi:hypothetical protein